mgnify:CR=1 FL=1
MPEAWGKLFGRSVAWEVLTAKTLLQAGEDILVLRHPESVKQVKLAIDKLMKA